MEIALLIIIMIIALITMFASIMTAIIITKDSKHKELIKKVLKAFGIVIAVIVLIALTCTITFLEPKNKESKKETTTASTTSELSNAGFNEVTLDEYLNLVKGSEKSIVLIARPTCSFCEKFTPVLKQAKEDMNLKINYINTDNLSEDDWDKFNNSVKFLNEEEWGTPTVLIVQNGDSVAENQGYVELDTIKEFFKENGFGE